MQTAARFVRRPGVSAAASHVFASHPLHADAARVLEAAGLELDAPAPGDAAATPLPRAALLPRAARSAALMCFMPDSIDADFVGACPHLRVVAGVLRGYDNFDLPALTAAGAYFTRCEDLLTAPTAELAVGLAIGLGRHVLAGDARVRSGAFAGWRPELYGAGLDGAVVGILGLGAVGRALAERLRGFGVARILYADADAAGAAAWARAAAAAWAAGSLPGAAPPPALEAVPDAAALLARADLVFPLTTLSAGSRHAVGASALAAAQPHALLVNVGRGGCVDEAAVAAALAAGRLGGYAADVFELEDWALEQRPRAIPAALLAPGARTLFTPHLGSAVASVRRAMEVHAAESVVDVLVRGVRPRGAVNQPAAPLA